MRALVAGSVVWYEKLAGTLEKGAMPQLLATVVSVLIRVAKAVAESPTCTERLEGNTAAARSAVQPLQLVDKVYVPVSASMIGG